MKSQKTCRSFVIDAELVTVIFLMKSLAVLGKSPIPRYWTQHRARGFCNQVRTVRSSRIVQCVPSFDGQITARAIFYSFWYATSAFAPPTWLARQNGKYIKSCVCLFECLSVCVCLTPHASGSPLAKSGKAGNQPSEPPFSLAKLPPKKFEISRENQGRKRVRQKLEMDKQTDRYSHVRHMRPSRFIYQIPTATVHPLQYDNNTWRVDKIPFSWCHVWMWPMCVRFVYSRRRDETNSKARQREP